MTLMVFLGILVSLLILRLIPSLLLRLALAIPRHRLISIMHWGLDRKIGIALPGNNAIAQSPARPFLVWPAHAGHRRLVLVSSSLLVLAVLVSTAFWTWHSTGLMLLLR